MKESMTCTICGQKEVNCGCTPLEKKQQERIDELEEKVSDLEDEATELQGWLTNSEEKLLDMSDLLISVMTTLQRIEVDETVPSEHRDTLMGLRWDFENSKH